LGVAAASFQLMGEDLALIGGPDLASAGIEWERGLARLPATVRGRFVEEQARLAREAHTFLRKYNRSVMTRLDGYLALGRRCDFEYPWPVVAMLGICQVLTGLTRNRVYGLLGPTVRQLGIRILEQLAEGTEDVLRRTNRGIFADSTPTVLLGIHAHALRTRGDRELADALLDGPLPPLMDEESRAIARGLCDGLGVPDREERFRVLSALTLRHFGREQAIFSHHLGAQPARRESAVVKRLAALRAVPAPVVEHGWRGRRVVFRAYKLPSGFDIRDHATRVDHFGRAFVTSVTADRGDYDAAVRYVIDRFGKTSVSARGRS
jgi:hypothetical protein